MITILWISNINAQWNINTIGTMPNNNALSIVVAEGRNDGVKRVYATTDTEIWEWTYNGNLWTSVLVANGITPDLISLTAGDGRNDGNIRLYFTDWADGGTSYEASWNGTSWGTISMGSVQSGWHSSGITLGSGRNDGINRVYTIGSYGVYEYSWSGSNWSMTNSVANNWSEMYGAIGDSRNDGINRLLFSASCHWESSWGGSSYTTTGITSCSSSQGADAVIIGDGRNDGIKRIYVNTELAGRIEYTWNGTSYISSQVVQASQRGAIFLSALRADKKNRLYMSNSQKFPSSTSGPMLEYEWNNLTNQWDSIGVVVNAISGATAFMDAGSARNDDTLRLYAPDFSSGAIYEITSHNPNFLGGPTTSIKDDLNQLDLQIFPNPVKTVLSISSNSSSNELMDITLHDLMGRVVLEELNVDLNGIHVLNVSNVYNGIYLLSVRSSKDVFNKKIIIE